MANPWTALTVFDVAAICHEAWRELNYAQGNGTKPHWWSLKETEHENGVWSVQDRLLHGSNAPEAHNRWVVNFAPPDHPNAKPFDQLPQDAQAHGYLFSSIVESLRPYCQQVMTEEELVLEGIA